MNKWKVFVSQKLTAAANAVPFGNYVNIIGVPSMPSLADIIVNEATTGSLNNVDDALKVHVGSLGMNISIPFDLPEVNGNIIQGYFGGSAAYNFNNGQEAYAVSGGLFAPVVDRGNWKGGFRLEGQHVWAKDPSGVYMPGILPLSGTNIFLRLDYEWRDLRARNQ